MTSDAEVKQKYSEICNKYQIKGTIEGFNVELKGYLSPLLDSPLANVIDKELTSWYIHARNKSLINNPAKQFVEELVKKVTKKLDELVKN